MSHTTVAVTDEQFQSTVLESEVPVLVDFWAPWCMPCRAIAPVLEELAGDYAGKLVVAKVNTQQDHQAAIEYAIQGIPTMILFKDGKEIERQVGFRQKSELARWVDGHLADQAKAA